MKSMPGPSPPSAYASSMKSMPPSALRTASLTLGAVWPQYFPLSSRPFISTKASHGSMPYARRNLKRSRANVVLPTPGLPVTTQLRFTAPRPFFLSFVASSNAARWRTISKNSFAGSQPSSASISCSTAARMRVISLRESSARPKSPGVSTRACEPADERVAVLLEERALHARELDGRVRRQLHRPEHERLVALHAVAAVVGTTAATRIAAFGGKHLARELAAHERERAAHLLD